jgi:hypothetical protein
VSKKRNDDALPEATEQEGPATPRAEMLAPAPDPIKTIELWRDELATPAWLWAGMKIGKGWPIGKEVTRSEYDEAVEWAATVECR